ETATNEGVLHFTVSKEDAQKALKQAYNRVKGKVNIPGFRKGKVSYPVFVKMIGEEALYEDALNYALPQAYANAVKEADLDVVGQPKFDVEKMHKGGS
ncbi:trigger factor family protein, partial [Actinotignum schaalii]|nr:trigger factor family protein [Actinotignum schaalii]